MAKYVVQIEKTYTKTVVVDVEGDFDEALEKVKEIYVQGDICIGCEDWSRVDFEASLYYGQRPISEDECNDLPYGYIKL